MKIKKLNIKGFSHVELAIVILVVIGLGLVGYKVYQNTSHAGNTCSGSTFGYYNESRGYGSTGTCVKDIQQIVNGLTGSKLKVDGYYGPLTKAAVVNFQKTAFKTDKTQWDGVVGAKTWAQLCKLKPTTSSTVFDNAQKDACVSGTANPGSTSGGSTSGGSTSGGSTSGGSKVTVADYLRLPSYTAFSTATSNLGFSRDAQGVTFVTFNIFENLPIMSSFNTALKPLATLNGYSTSNLYTNVNNRNNGGGSAQNWNAIGVDRNTCHKNGTCSQGVLTQSQAYSVACGSLHSYNPVASLKQACDTYLNDVNIMNAFYGLIDKYNTSAQVLKKSSSTVLSSAQIAALNSAISSVSSSIDSYTSTVSNIVATAGTLNYGVMNKLNGNDYLNAYKSTISTGFCAVYNLDKQISNNNSQYNGVPIAVYASSTKLGGTTYNLNTQNDCKKLGNNPTGYGTVWWNNQNAVAAYGW